MFIEPGLPGFFVFQRHGCEARKARLAARARDKVQLMPFGLATRRSLQGTCGTTSGQFEVRGTVLEFQSAVIPSPGRALGLALWWKTPGFGLGGQC